MTCAWIDTSSALTGSSAMMIFGRVASAPQFRCGCRWPPKTRADTGSPVPPTTDFAEQHSHALAALRRCSPGVQFQRLLDDLLNRHSRIQRE